MGEMMGEIVKVMMKRVMVMKHFRREFDQIQLLKNEKF
jgi:hypothetical protein